MDSTRRGLRAATPDEQFSEVTRGAVDLHVARELRERLERSYETGAPLRVKAGFDPTAPDLHLGHAVLLARMRRFQEFGHTAIFLIGDFTGLIGDPTGRSATRPPLSREQVLANAETYKTQVFKILDPLQTEIRFNSEWHSAMVFADVIRLAARYTLARLLEREDFRTRYASSRPIGVHELLYPLAQAYDSVALACDVELGSTDQLFNLLVGRALMPDYGLPAQVVLTGPLLEGLHARPDPSSGRLVGDKMSKSLGNYVGIAEPADEQFGKIMSIGDELMWRWYELLSLRPEREVAEMRRGHPRAAKVALAHEIVTRFHGPEEAARAQDRFERLHVAKQAPDTVEERTVSLGGARSLPIATLLADVGLAASKSEARRLILQGGVRVGGRRVSDVHGSLGEGEHLVGVGKRRYLRLKIG